jgi:hypothetical protein
MMAWIKGKSTPNKQRAKVERTCMGRIVLQDARCVQTEHVEYKRKIQLDGGASAQSLYWSIVRGVLPCHPERKRAKKAIFHKERGNCLVDED